MASRVTNRVSSALAMRLRLRPRAPLMRALATAGPAPPPPPHDKADDKAAAAGAAPASSRLYRVVEDVKDIFAVAFNLERRRDVAKEYDLGIRKYPWVVYPDVAGALVYRNRETGLATDVKPADFDARAGPDAFLVLNTDASAVAVVRDGAAADSAWDRSLEALRSSALAQSLRAAGAAVAASPVGGVAAAAAGRLQGVRDRYVESWESSQHPLVVSSSYVVDSLLTETEQGKAVREMKLLDAEFDEFSFVAEMRDAFVPAIARAFFRFDEPLLKQLCRETALAQCRSHQAARESAGLWRHDGVILNVSRVELLKAQTLEAGVPLLLVSSQIQYIHTVRNKKGEIAEGSESEVRASMLVLAVVRELDPVKGVLVWRAAELAFHGGQLYL